MKKRRWLALVLAVAVGGFVPIIVVSVAQVFTSPGSGPSQAERRRAVGGVAMSSPVDADAKFYWEISPPPRALIPLEEIISGGPPPDGIPPIDQPLFESPSSAAGWVSDNEPVLAFELNGRARAYPVQVMIWHEIVNDVIAGEPVVVTYCPLCNSAIVFSRRVGDLVLDFGTSGRLWRSDLVMYDRQTKSMWPQIEGRAVVGKLIESELDRLPSGMLSFREWRAANPNGEVLSKNTGHGRSYGINPYSGYDIADEPPGFFRGEIDGRLLPKERVLAVRVDGRSKAYPFEKLAASPVRVVRDRVGRTDLVVFYRRGTASALDHDEIARGRDVGATGVFSPKLGARTLTFEVRSGEFTDRETGSRWNLLGHAIAGPLKGQKLQGIEHIDTFWFAWAAFRPDTAIWKG